MQAAICRQTRAAHRAAASFHQRSRGPPHPLPPPRFPPRAGHQTHRPPRRGKSPLCHPAETTTWGNSSVNMGLLEGRGTQWPAVLGRSAVSANMTQETSCWKVSTAVTKNTCLETKQAVEQRKPAGYMQNTNPLPFHRKRCPIKPGSTAPLTWSHPLPWQQPVVKGRALCGLLLPFASCPRGRARRFPPLPGSLLSNHGWIFCGKSDLLA